MTLVWFLSGLWPDVRMPVLWWVLSERALAGSLPARQWRRRLGAGGGPGAAFFDNQKPRDECQGNLGGALCLDKGFRPALEQENGQLCTRMVDRLLPPFNVSCKFCVSLALIS